MSDSTVSIPRKLYDDLVFCLTEAVEAEFPCNCNAVYECDTNAWVHVDSCWSFMEDHVEHTLAELEALTVVSPNQPASQKATK